MTSTAWLSEKGNIMEKKKWLAACRGSGKKQREQLGHHKQIILQWKTWQWTKELECKGECTINKPCVIVGPRLKHCITWIGYFYGSGVSMRRMCYEGEKQLCPQSFFENLTVIWKEYKKFNLLSFIF